MASMMRRFAWCGMNAEISAGVTPAGGRLERHRGQGVVASGTRPDRLGQLTRPTLDDDLVRLVPALPHTMGPIPDGSPSAHAPTTAAPAPSRR